MITLSSPWVAMDGTFDVSGHGFGHNEGVSFALNGITVGTATSTATGTLAAKAFTVPATDNFGPQTLVASGKINGKAATSAALYVTNSWSQYRGGAAHTGSELNDQALNHHLGPLPAQLSRSGMELQRRFGGGWFGRRGRRCRLSGRR